MLGTARDEIAPILELLPQICEVLDQAHDEVHKADRCWQGTCGRPRGTRRLPEETSTGGINEVQMGFPGVKLKLAKGHYAFSLTYTEKRADVVTITPVFGHITHEPARATVTGTVESSKLIAGTVSVRAAGCGLPKSKYKAAPPKTSG